MVGDYNMVGKHYFYESSIREPMMIKYPGKKPTVIKDFVSLTDLYGTILTFAGISHKDTVDLKYDPTEQINLLHSKDYESIRKEMRKLMDKRIFEGIEEGNIDQKVIVENLNIGFNYRNWVRPYPQSIDWI